MNGDPFYRRPRIACEGYLAWIRCLPCAVCGSRFKSHAHHRIGHGRLGGKTDDFEAIPLCHKCHNELHNNDEGGWEAFERKHEWSQLDEVRETLLAACREGVLKLDTRAAKFIAG